MFFWLSIHWLLIFSLGCHVTNGTILSNFFPNVPVSKEDMEKLRQALKTLSEAEKQLRMSNDKLTWLTAALLQLAPDQQYMLPSSSAEDTSFNHSPLPQNDGRAVTRKGGMDRAIVSNTGRHLSTDRGMEKYHESSPGGTHDGSKVSGSRRQGVRIASHETSTYDDMRVTGKRGKGHTEIEDIWLEVLQNIQISYIREFMYQEGKLISVSYGAGTDVSLGDHRTVFALILSFIFCVLPLFLTIITKIRKLEGIRFCC